MFRYAILLLIILLSGCSKDDPISSPNLAAPASSDGEWSATVTGEFSVDMQVTQNVSVITGVASLTPFPMGQTVEGNLFGKEVFPKFTAKIYIPGYLAVEVTGEFLSDTTLDTYFNQSGFDNTEVVFHKQSTAVK